MRKTLLLIFTGFLALNSYSQISFKNGYFIDNSGNKKEVLIKYVDWRNNPTKFEYRESENSEVRTAGIETVQEFSIQDTSKFLRAKIEIDRSSGNINKLSEEKEPVFNQEELFLKVLLEGEATLYQYSDGPLKRYFFSKNDSEIRQLIYKRYAVSDMKFSTNNEFREQLWNNLKCGNLHISEMGKVEYEEDDLLEFFRKYNKCRNAEITFQGKEEKDLFDLNLRPRLNNSSMNVRNSRTTARDTDFDDKISLGFGIEAEFTPPFYNNKWSFIIEPSYQSFKTTKVNNQSIVEGGTLVSKIDYRSIELSVGFRHYFFLNDRSKIFVNASHVWDYIMPSQIDFYREDGSKLGKLDLDKSTNLSFGAGYKYNDRYSVEIRYFTSREVLRIYEYYDSDFRSISLIFGYTLF
jgi:hypothetical protein